MWWGEKKILFLILIANAKSHLANREWRLQPQAYRELHNLIIILERKESLTATSTSPARKYKGSWGGGAMNDSFWRTQLFHLHPRNWVYVSRLFMSRPRVILWGKIKHIKQMYPHILKSGLRHRVWQALQLLELLNPPLRRDQRINFLYHDSLCLFQRLKIKIEHIKFPI